MNYVWTHLIRIECEFTQFAFNVLSSLRSCRQALNQEKCLQLIGKEVREYNHSNRTTYMYTVQAYMNYTYISESCVEQYVSRGPCVYAFDKTGFCSLRVAVLPSCTCE